jgi:predicted MPP superfamily phosphohydrolase
MKILTIPDVHARNDWKTPCKVDEFDKIVFLGDYVDSFDIPRKDELANLLEIIEFRDANPDKVVLLVGNHDNQYIYYHSPIFSSVRCSGFNSSAAWKLNKTFTSNLYKFKAAWEYENLLFTHAGLTNDHYIKDIEPMWDKSMSLSEFLNLLWISRNSQVFKIGPHRGGSDDVGSIFWADKRELIEDPLMYKHQIVGHTHCAMIETHRSSVRNSEVTFTDCRNQYFVINI